MSLRYFVKQMIAFCLAVFYRVFCFFIPVDEKRVLYIAYHGRGYLDNPKAIHEFLAKDARFLGFRHIWALRNKQLKVNNARVVGYLSFAYFYQCARSKYWISNCKLPAYLLKKSTQVYLQTWHGTPLKRLAYDLEVPEGTKFYRTGLTATQMRATYAADVKRYNYMISPNQFTTEVFQSAFQINRKRLIETGYPRNDRLSHYTQEDVQLIREKIGLPSDKKVILYAPTWRDNAHSLTGYSFQLEVDFQKWQEALSSEWIVLFKPHYLINSQVDCSAFQGFVYPIDANAEISELYLISDVLVTDYSSAFFDFAILKRPIYFYMYDLESYQDQLRGFYLNIEEDLPGPIIENEERLIQAIANSMFDQQKLAQFNARFNHIEDGQATARVVNIVF